MCSANSLIAPFPPTLWHVYFAALTATVGASPGTALKPARFRIFTSGSSLPGRKHGTKTGINTTGEGEYVSTQCGIYMKKQVTQIGKVIKEKK